MVIKIGQGEFILRSSNDDIIFIYQYDILKIFKPREINEINNLTIILMYKFLFNLQITFSLTTKKLIKFGGVLVLYNIGLKYYFINQNSSRLCQFFLRERGKRVGD